MIKIHNNTHSKQNFIRGWYLENIDICDDIIKYFNSSSNTYQGRINQSQIDSKVKDSLDCILDDENLLTRYLKSLQTVIKEYVNVYPYANYYSPWTVIEPVVIQKYNPNQAYFGWHTERAGAERPVSTRHLVFMTYLNDITLGGETEFFHQELKVSPEKGLTLIWPSDWTFTHRGCPAPEETKYIVTGWLNYTL
jgi:prolyl 4-hydroxylase